jgi:hypothetical protein
MHACQRWIGAIRVFAERHSHLENYIWPRLRCELFIIGWIMFLDELFPKASDIVTFRLLNV